MMNKYNLCFNDRAELYDKSIWIVWLSNDRVVYDDHDNAWAELKRYVLDNNLKIIGMALRFRSHWEHITPEAEGYYFARGCGAGAGVGNGQTSEIFFVGTLKNGIITVQDWHVPELVVQFDTTLRDPEQAGDKLISNVSQTNQKQTV